MYKSINIIDNNDEVVKFLGVDNQPEKGFTNFAFEIKNSIVNVNVSHNEICLDDDVITNNTFKQLVNYLVCKDYIYRVNHDYFLNKQVVETLPKYKIYTVYTKRKDFNRI